MVSILVLAFTAVDLSIGVFWNEEERRGARGGMRPARVEHGLQGGDVPLRQLVLRHQLRVADRAVGWCRRRRRYRWWIATAMSTRHHI